ncbi:hypothetical protein ACHAPT_000066 [Fusarium lateritium]
MLTLAPSGFHRNDFRLLPSVRQALEQNAKNEGYYHSLQVMPAPEDVPYLAFSYVWGFPQEAITMGAPASDGSRSIGGIASLPATIADAISVTVKLGFRYLWVDRYCIDQYDKAIRDHQTAQMDSIYNNAELTIIAAAGGDAQYGLPGVGSRPRSTQQIVKVGNMEIVPTMRHPHAAIQSSRWSKRAWTFQEGVLSRRRLVFTDDQMYFECGAMNCHESVTNMPERGDDWSDTEYCEQIECSLDQLHVSYNFELNSTLRPGILGWDDKQRFGQPDREDLHANFVRFLEMVKIYSARELSSTFDALRAFDGVANKFEVLTDRVNQLWGIPFYGDEERLLEETFVAGLAWHHTERGSHEDEDEEANLPSPRYIFPSWSWMGWNGEVEYGEHHLYKAGYESAFKSAVASVFVEHDDGSMLTLSEYVEEFELEMYRFNNPREIEVEAYAFPTAAFAVKGSHLTCFGNPTTLHVPIADRSGCLSLAPEDSKVENNWKCIYLGSVENKKIGMIVCRWGKKWERVGLLFAWGNKLDQWCEGRPRQIFRVR